MDITALSQPQVYLPKAQARFDAAAQKVVDAAAAQASDEPDAGPSELAGALVRMNEEGLMNRVLYGVARKQAEVGREAADLIKPR
jgi:hypothetical protein